MQITPAIAQGTLASSRMYRYSNSNIWYSVLGSGNTVALSANDIIVVPFPVDVEASFKEFGIRVQATGTTCSMGIYKDDGQGYPSSLISSTVSSIDTSVTETRTGTFTPTTLPPDLYWIACMALTTATTLHSIEAQTWGAIGPQGAGTLDLQFTLPGYWFATGSGALPTIWPATRNRANRSFQFAIRVA